MELKLYTAILLKRWRLVAAAFVLTMLLTGILVSRQEWVYEATTTFIIRPSPAFNEAASDFVRAMDTLSRHTDINATFSQVAGSRAIKEGAIERLGLSENERKGLQISGSAIAGSNILEISVRGPRPGVAQEMANAVGLETQEFMRGLYDVFELELLDAATIPSRPAGPNKTLTLLVGAMMGAMLGVGIVFLAEYLSLDGTPQEPEAATESINSLEGEDGISSRDYFYQRLKQENSRTRKNELSFGLAAIRLQTTTADVAPNMQAALTLLATVKQKLYDEDILARVGNDLFGLILPGRSEEEISELLTPLGEELRNDTAAHGASASPINVKATHDLITPDATQQDPEAQFAALIARLDEQADSAQPPAAGASEDLPASHPAANGNESSEPDSERTTPSGKWKRRAGR